MRFLAIGECMAELSQASQPMEYRLGYAGDTFNTAWYLAKQIPPKSVSFYSAVGKDAISEKMLAFISDSGIDNTSISVLDDRTVGLYLISLLEGERTFTYWRDHSAAKLLAQNVDTLTAALTKADFLFFSGITLAILDSVSREHFLQVIQRSRESGKFIAFDPNLRPRLWQDTTTMVESIMRAAKVSDLVLPSFEDESIWFSDNTSIDTLDRYRAVGVDTIVVKDGSKPVSFYDKGEQGKVDIPKAPTVIDTTAAGDSFNAGFIASHYFSNKTIAESIAHASSLARQVIQSHGALVDINSSSVS